MLSIERYATSKINDDSDLFSIRTLGFRGEALPSISSVSRFTLVTRRGSDESGIEIRMEGGKVKGVSEVGAPAGTMITVRQLFFNTPARRKFLKTIATETAHITDSLTVAALAWPKVHFTLRHNGKTVEEWPDTTDDFQRIMDVLGKDVKDRMAPVSYVAPDLSIKGWAARPRNQEALRGVFSYSSTVGMYGTGPPSTPFLPVTRSA